MSTWSRNRKILYGGTTVSIIVIILIVAGIKLLYVAPTCFDGRLNGSEQGVDCGGSCQKLCPSAFLPPMANWTRFEQVASKFYNVAAYVVNPNIDGEAKNVPYHVQLFDSSGVIIVDYSGTVNIPPHRNTLAFQGAVNVQERTPVKALFEFTGAPDWNKMDDRLAALSVISKEYSEDENGSYLNVTLKNSSVKPLGKISVYVVLYDKGGNSLGFSKTIIDGIDAGGTTVAPFTWAMNRNGAVISIEVLPVAE